MNVNSLGKPLIAFSILLLSFALSGCSGQSSNDSYTVSFKADSEEEQHHYVTKNEALLYHWNEVKNNLTGTESIEACTNGKCYGLDAELYRGSVDLIYFQNGGRVHFDDAEFNSEGYAYGLDSDGNSWELILDMKRSTLVKKAVQKWAASKGLLIE